MNRLEVSGSCLDVKPSRGLESSNGVYSVSRDGVETGKLSSWMMIVAGPRLFHSCSSEVGKRSLREIKMKRILSVNRLCSSM
jgi:hypothetical protein